MVGLLPPTDHNCLPNMLFWVGCHIPICILIIIKNNNVIRAMALCHLLSRQPFLVEVKSVCIQQIIAIWYAIVMLLIYSLSQIYPHVVNYGRVDSATNTIRFRLSRPCSAGQECCLSYGNLSTSHLATFYGFLPQGYNPYDVIPLGEFIALSLCSRVYNKRSSSTQT